MPVTGIHHSAVVVSDLRRAAAFYRDILGLTEVATPSTFTFPDPEKRVRWFQCGADQQIHLMPGTPVKQTAHVALQTDDAVGFREQLRRHGIAIDEVPAVPGADRFYLRDPDGNLVEIIEWQTPWPEADPAPVAPVD